MDSFFGIGIPELILILVIAGIVMGPERLGVTARWLGKTTAQLQSISRGFMQQLDSEIDGIQNTEEFKGTLQEMQDLRSQLDQLKNELVSATNGTVRETKASVEQIQNDLERSIAPPNRRQLAANPAVEAVDSEPQDSLPKRIEVPDDPEL